MFYCLFSSAGSIWQISFASWALVRLWFSQRWLLALAHLCSLTLFTNSLLQFGSVSLLCPYHSLCDIFGKLVSSNPYHLVCEQANLFYYVNKQICLICILYYAFMQLCLFTNNLNVFNNLLYGYINYIKPVLNYIHYINFLYYK